MSIDRISREAVLQEASAIRSARVLGLIIRELFPGLTSVVEVGDAPCPVAQMMQRWGVSRCDCIVSPESLSVSRSMMDPGRTEVRQFFEPFRTPLRYDICVSISGQTVLQNAHIEHYLNNICSLSDTILFACPSGATGEGVRTRWLSWWRDRFSERGYEMIDGLRSRLWQDSAVDWRIAESICFFVKRGVSVELSEKLAHKMPMDVLHPFVLREARIERSGNSRDVGSLSWGGQDLVVRLEAERDRERENAAAAWGAHNRLQSALDQENEKRAELERAYQSVSQQLTDVSHQLNEVRSSTSWKLTGPLRWVADTLGIGRGRGQLRVMG